MKDLEFWCEKNCHFSQRKIEVIDLEAWKLNFRLENKIYKPIKPLSFQILILMIFFELLETKGNVLPLIHLYSNGGHSKQKPNYTNWYEERENNSKYFIISGQYQTKMATVIGIVLCQYWRELNRKHFCKSHQNISLMALLMYSITPFVYLTELAEVYSNPMLCYVVENKWMMVKNNHRPSRKLGKKQNKILIIMQTHQIKAKSQIFWPFLIWVGFKGQ